MKLWKNNIKTISFGWDQSPSKNKTDIKYYRGKTLRLPRLCSSILAQVLLFRFINLYYYYYNDM